MTSYTETFGGNTLYPSDVSYLALSLTTDTQTYWPLDANTGVPVLARIVDITPSGAYAVILPDATLTGAGQTVLFNNLGPSTVTIKNFSGGTVATITAGTAWTIYLTSNATAAGSWRVFQQGAYTAQAQASALAGYGLTATGATLSQSTPVTTLNSTYTAGAADRAKMLVWTGGLGDVNLPSVSTVMNGYYVSFSNQGAGDWTVNADGSDLIDGAATLVLPPQGSVTLATDTTGWYTLGLGATVQSDFDFTSIDLTGQSSPYTLSGAELNRVAYEFVGTLVANMVVVIPSTIQQYWITNSTTGGSYTLSFRTASQTPALTVVRNTRGIFYCTGSAIIDADTSTIATPIAIADGGTGATTATAAVTNLGGTTVGAALFTASSASVARTTLGSTAVGDALFTAASASAARTTLGATAVGDAVFIAASTSAAQTAIGATVTGAALFTAASASAARTTLGSTTVGDAVFIAASTGAAQTALALVPGTNVQAYSANLQAISGVTSAADRLFYFTGSGTGALATFTSVARTLVGQATQALMRTTGLGSTTVGDALFTTASASAARTTLGVVIGTDVQAYSANLAAVAGVTSAANKLFYFTGSGTGAVTDLTSQSRSFLATTTGSAALATLFTPGTLNSAILSDGAGGWAVSSLPVSGEWFATSTTTIAAPTTSVVVTIPPGYAMMSVELIGITSSLAPSLDSVSIEVSNDGGSNYASVLQTPGVALPLYGDVFFPDYLGEAEAVSTIYQASSSSSALSAAGTAALNPVRHSGGVNRVRVRCGSGNLTAGMIKVKLK